MILIAKINDLQCILLNANGSISVKKAILLNANGFICTTDEGIDNFSTNKQPWNAYSSINLTEEGIEISFNDEQFKKVHWWISLIDGIGISFKFKQWLKASIPIDVTDDGIGNTDSNEQLIKAPCPIEVKEEVIIV